jgi:hypothetical protein
MKTRFLYFGLVIGLLVNALAWAQPVTTAQRGFMWEAQKGEQKIYLMGTIHVGQTNYFPFAPAVMQRLKQAESIALEADMSDAKTLQTIVQKIALYPSSDPGLEGRLSPDLKKRLKAVLGETPTSIWQCKPWFLANNIIMVFMMQRGHSFAYSTEMFLTQFAKANGKPITEIEGAEKQLKIFDGAPETMQMAYLEEVVKSIESGEAEKETKTLIAAWETSDFAGLEKFHKEKMQATTPVEQRFFKLLFDDRHPGMVAAIEKLAATGKVHVVAVGTLHYTGSGGLLALLEKRGYKVQQVR